MYALLASVLRASVLGACVLVIPFVSLQDVWADKGPDNVIVTNTTANPVPVVIQGGTAHQRQSVEIVTTLANNTTVAVYTVATGKTLTITDVIMSANASANFGFINRNGATVSRVYVNGNYTSTYEHSYVSGIGFTESQTVSIGTGNIGGPMNFELRGFLE